MSDDPKQGDETAWEMPEPVFRSSEGQTPGVVKSEAITDEIEVSADSAASAVDESSKDISAAITEEIPGFDSQARGGGFGSFLTILVVIAILAGVLIAALYYVLSARPVDTTF